MMEQTSKKSKVAKRARSSEGDSEAHLDLDLNAPSSSSSTSKLTAKAGHILPEEHEEVKQSLDEDDEDEGGDQAAQGEDEDEERETRKSTHVKKKKKSKHASPGIVYVSRLPPGMTPQKVRHLMARWGEVGKVYAQRKDAPTGYNPNANNQNQKKQKHQAANFTEAWVEFMDKSIAKTVASMLNAQVIGGKKGDKWRDDIWTMKYLSGFKWEMLGEQVAYERQAHQARLRTEIARSKTEQSEYLKNVELARVLEKRKAKAKKDDTTSSSIPNATAGPAEGAEKGNGKNYRQRQAVEKTRTLAGKGMDDVLGNIFG